MQPNHPPASALLSRSSFGRPVIGGEAFYASYCFSLPLLHAAASVTEARRSASSARIVATPPNHDLSSPLGASRRLGWCLSFFRLCPISSAGAREDYVSRHLRLGAFRSRYVWLSGLWPLKYMTTHRLLRQPSFSCICVSVIFTPRPPTLPLEFTCNHSQK